MLACTCFALILAAAAPPIVVVRAPLFSPKAEVAYLDPATRAIGEPVTFDGFPSPLYFDADADKLFLVVRRKGMTSIWSIEGGAGPSALIADLGEEVIHHALDKERKRLYVVAGYKHAKPKTVTRLDLASGRMQTLASIEGMTGFALSPDGRLMYALCDGPLGVHVVDTTTGTELARLDGARAPTRVEFDRARDLGYVLGATDGKGMGVVTVVRGAEVVGRFATHGIPAALRRGPDGATFILTSGAVVALDATGMTATRTWDLGFGPFNLIFDPEHDRMFAGGGPTSKIAEIRISTGEVIVKHATGNAGRKFARSLSIAPRSEATEAAKRPFSTIQNETSMLLAADGGTLYVLNPSTDDLSTFDVAKQDVVDIVHVGHDCRRIVQFPEEPVFWIETSDRLVRFDTVTKRIDRAVEFHAPALVTYDPARKLAWVATEAKIVVVDLRTGESTGELGVPKGFTFLWQEAPPE